MAIVKMSKFHLLAFKENEERMLNKLQNFEYVHLLGKKEEDVEVVLEEDGNLVQEVRVDETLEGSVSNDMMNLTKVTAELEEVKSAIKILKPFDTRPKGLKGLKIGNPDILFTELEGKFLDSNYKEHIKEVNEIRSRIDELKAKKAEINSEIIETDNLSLLDESPMKIEKLSVVKAIIGSIPRKLDEKFHREINELDEVTFKKIGENKDEYFFLVAYLENEEEALKEIFRANSFSEYKAEYDEVPLERKSRLKKESAKIMEDISSEKSKLKELNVYLKDLEIAFEYLNNRQLKILARNDMRNTKYLVSVTGYIPMDKKGIFKEQLREAMGEDFYIELTKADENDENVPVLLENNKVNSSFEGLTSMYGTPKYNEIDPTPFMAPFYLVFFGMMLADAGYGLLMLIGTAFALKFFNLSDKMRSSVRFFFYLSFPTILFGVLYGSYFSLDYQGWRLLDPSKDFMKIMVISIIMGAVHMFLALGLKAFLYFRNRDYLGALYDVGFWYFALIGAIVFGLSKAMPQIPQVVSQVFKWVMIVGMVGIILFTGRDAKTKGGRIASGLYNLYGISGWLGDFVSYSRLMALGLSGGFIGMAINMIAKMVAGKWYFLPLAIVIFAGGHLFNLFIGGLGAYVHTARLNYVEFFGKFFQGGGKKFKKFRTEEKYVNYK